jgi:hypothetical protein
MKSMFAFALLTLSCFSFAQDVAFQMVGQWARSPRIIDLRMEKKVVGERRLRPAELHDCYSRSSDEVTACGSERVKIWERRPVVVVAFRSFLDARLCDFADPQEERQQALANRLFSASIIKKKAMLSYVGDNCPIDVDNSFGASCVPQTEVREGEVTLIAIRRK